MVCEYSGFLSTVLPGPEAPTPDDVAQVVITPDDLARWALKDQDSEREWQKIPVHRARTDSGIELTGKFEDIRRMDILGVDDPRFWVPLSSLGCESGPFPVKLKDYPILEITYRCTSENARPALAWIYQGGASVAWLPPSRQWRTVARRVPHGGFPRRLDQLTVRLYATTRTTESIEIRQIRFREMSPAESAAYEGALTLLEAEGPPRRYPVLDEFLPLGVVMDAQAARRLAEMMGVSLAEYWELAFEDLVIHHNNCVALDNIEQLTAPEWTELLSLADRYKLKIVGSHGFPLEDDPERMRAAIELRIKPYAESTSVLAWSLLKGPGEEHAQRLATARALVEEVDTNHPTAVVSDRPTGFPLLACNSPVAGLAYQASHRPWGLGQAVRSHVRLAKGQQFWVIAPTFTYATGMPEWSTCPELRLMANLAFANGARGWFSYAYHNDPVWVSGSCQRTLTGPFLNFSDLWLELDRRMERVGALAPLLLAAEPARLPKKWYVTSDISADMTQIPEGLAPTTSYRLQGADFQLFFVVSNDIRGMSSLNISIPRQALRGQEIFVLSDFVQDRLWRPMNLERHLEMFPGQSHVVLVAEPALCARWRDIIAERLVDDDRGRLDFNLDLAHTYGLDVGPVENLIESVGNGDPLKDLETMDRARDLLVDLIYESEDICRSRSAVIRAASAVCACDGALCRLVNRGRADQARELGTRVIPMAREITKLRLEIRQGRGASVSAHCEDLVDRVLALLGDIRART
ncbi:MAG: hypothetical protein JXR94_17935 [Candidatus Hydrogenedentes bacterium]|nr:hypothetical protein [Candidatus Hydrogenedentota bacterium]